MRGVTEDITVLVDADNQLGELFGFKAVPNGIFISPEGEVDAIKAGRFDIRRAESRSLIDQWLSDGTVPSVDAPGGRERSESARRFFLEAGAAVRAGRSEEAVLLLKAATQLEPDNFIIRKQLWAIENPERFYSGEIDTVWQKARLERGE